MLFSFHPRNQVSWTEIDNGEERKWHILINSELKQHESLVPCFMQQILPTEYNIHSNITANNESTTTALLAKFVTQKVLGIST